MMTTAPDHITSTAPKRIYLDLGDCAHLIKPEETFATYAQGEVTWSAGNDSGVGIPYVRADLASPTYPASGALPADLTIAERAELDQLRLLAGGNACIPEVQRVLGPISLWSAAALKDHIAREVVAALASREAQHSPAPLTDEQIASAYSEIYASDYPARAAYDLAIGRAVLALASPQVAPAQRNTMRAFEAWYCSDGNYEPEELDKLVGGACYANADTENMWQAWQGAFIRLATPVQVAPPPVESTVMGELVKWSAEAVKLLRSEDHEVRDRLRAVLAMVATAAPVAPQDDARDAAQPPAVAWVVECWMGSQERGGWVPQFPARQSEDEAKFDMQMFKTPFKRVVSLHRDFHTITPAAKPTEEQP